METTPEKQFDCSEMQERYTKLERFIKSYRDELGKVREIQASLLPDFSNIKNFDITSIFLPAEDISGDFIDAFYLSESILQIVLCDISGHGLASSYIGNEFRTVIRLLSKSDITPDKIMYLLNENVSNDLKDLYYFGTLIIMHIDLNSGLVTLASGGHPPVLYYDSNKKKIKLLESTGRLVGLFTDSKFRMHTFTMHKDDKILLYTDGITESHPNENTELFGEERLAEVFKQNITGNSDEVVFSIIDAVYEFTDYTNQEDDISIICINRQ